MSENLNDLKLGSDACMAGDLQMKDDFGSGGSGRGRRRTGLGFLDFSGINLNGNSIDFVGGDTE